MAFRDLFFVNSGAPTDDSWAKLTYNDANGHVSTGAAFNRTGQVMHILMWDNLGNSVQTDVPSDALTHTYNPPNNTVVMTDAGPNFNNSVWYG